MEIRWQVEIDPVCRKVVETRWPAVRRYEDVRTVGDELERVDVLCGGFPCQDISYAGAGAGIEGVRSGLWSEYARLIRELRPRYAIVENVSALLSRGLDRVLGDLASIGYDAEWHCIPAAAVGAPHRRDRIWIIAYSNSESGLQAHPLLNSFRARSNTWHDVSRSYWGALSNGDWQIPQPVSLGVDDGISYRMDRYKQLGNAVVPQIPELIGRAIMAR